MIDTLTPLVHNKLKDINNVEPLSAQDSSCLEEIKEILQKFNCEDKFGITLLHKHFDLVNDEIMVESIDSINRILTTQPIKIEKTKEKSLVQTVWAFSNNENLNKSCQSVCPKDKSGRHLGYRDHW